MIATIILGILVAATANALVWLFRSRKQWHAIKPYPFWTRLSVVTPFSRRWESDVQPQDRPAVAQFRKGFIRNYYVLFFGPLLAGLTLLTTHSYLEYRQAKRDLATSQQRLEQLREAASDPAGSPQH